MRYLHSPLIVTDAYLNPHPHSPTHHHGIINPQVFEDLEDEGHFYDPITKEVKEVFLPWLMDDVVEKVQKAVDSMAVVEGECGRLPTVEFFSFFM